MTRCKICNSFAINHHAHGRDGSDGDLCDVCYWRKRAERVTTLKASLVIARAVLEAECGGRCNAEYNPCQARDAITLIDTTLKE